MKISLSWFVFITFLFVTSGCKKEEKQDSRRVDIGGTWVLHTLLYDSVPILPNDLTHGKDKFEIAGVGSFDKIVINERDSSIVFPGFESGDLKLQYHRTDNTLNIYYVDSLQNAHRLSQLPLRNETTLNEIPSKSNTPIDQHDKAMDVYTGSFKVVNYGDFKTIKMTSDKTMILMVLDSAVLDGTHTGIFAAKNDSIQ